MSQTTTTNTDAPPQTSYSLWQMVRYMLALGTWGFGGPVALVGYMYRDLVERRCWISESDYKEGMALAQLMPRPLVAQLAIYLGYVHHRVLWCPASGAPWWPRLALSSRATSSPSVDGVTAAAIGAI